MDDMGDFDSLDELEAIAAPAGKKKKLPPWAIIPVIGVVAVIGVAGAMASGQKADKGGQMETVKAEREDVRQVYNTTGTVGSDKEKVFYCPVNAPIAQCNVKVGQVVKAGDLLVSFDTSTAARMRSSRVAGQRRLRRRPRHRWRRESRISRTRFSRSRQI